MSTKTLNLSTELHQYLIATSLREAEVCRALREATDRLPQHNMMSSPEQVQLITLLAKTLNARKVIEVGTFTGYTALCIALALPVDGSLICCEISDQWQDLAQGYWQRAQVHDKIDLRIAPAQQTLDTLLQENQHNQFDMAYIDADKAHYLDYYQRCLELVRPGGLVLTDNTLWDGAVIDKNDHSESTTSIRRFNQTLHQDHRVDISLIPIGDGLTVARKR